MTGAEVGLGVAASGLKKPAIEGIGCYLLFQMGLILPAAATR